MKRTSSSLIRKKINSLAKPSSQDAPKTKIIPEPKYYKTNNYLIKKNETITRENFVESSGTPKSRRIKLDNIVIKNYSDKKTLPIEASKINNRSHSLIRETIPVENNSVLNTLDYNNFKDSSNNNYSKISGFFKIIDEVRKKIDNIKKEENISKNKSKIDKLMIKLKSDIQDISRNIKHNDDKMENFIKNNSRHPRNMINLKKNEFANNNYYMNTNNNTLSNYSNSNYNIRTNSNHNMSNDLDALQEKNDDLSKELFNLKEKFIDLNLQNIHLKNQLKDRSVDNKDRNKSQSKYLNMPLRTEEKSKSKDKLVKVDSPRKKKEVLIVEQEKKIQSLLEKNEENESSIIKLENKLESTNNLVQDLMSKSKNYHLKIQELKEENANLKKYKVFNITKDPIIIHSTFKVNDINNFVLISDSNEKIFSWVNLYFPENKEILKFLNSDKNCDKEGKIKYKNLRNFNNSENEIRNLKNKISEIEVEFEETKKFLVNEIDLKEKKLHEYKLELEKTKPKVDLETLKVKINNKENLIRELNDQIEEKNEIIKNFEITQKENLISEEKVNEIIKENEDLRNLIENIKIEIDAKEKEYEEEMENKNNLIENYAKEYNELKNTFEEEFLALQEKYNTELAEVSEINENLNAKLQEFAEEISSKDNEITQLTESIKKLTNLVEEHKNQNVKSKNDSDLVAKANYEFEQVKAKLLKKEENLIKDVEDLNQKLSEMEKANLTLETVIQEKQMQLENLGSIKESIEENLNAEVEEKEAIIEEFKVFHAEFESTKNNLELKIQENDDLIERLESISEEYKKLNENYLDQMAKITDYQEEIFSLKKQIQNNKDETNNTQIKLNQDMKEELEEKESYISKLLNEIEELQKIVEEGEEKLNQINQFDQIEQVEYELQNKFEIEKASILEDLARSQIEIEELKGKLKRHEEIISEIDEINNKTLLQNKDLAIKFKECEGNLVRANSELVSVKNKNETLLRELEELIELKNAYNNDSVSNEEVILNFKKEITQNYEKISELENIIIGYKDSFANTTKNNKQLQDENNSLKNTISNLNEKIEVSLNTFNDEKLKLIEMKDALIKEESGIREIMELEIAELKESIEQYENINEGLSEELNELKRRLFELAEKVDEAKSTIEAKEEIINQMTISSNKKVNEVELIKSEHETSKNIINKLKKEKSDLEMTIEEIDREKEHILSKLKSDYEYKIDELVKQKEELEFKMENIKKEINQVNEANTNSLVEKKLAEENIRIKSELTNRIDELTKNKLELESTINNLHNQEAEHLELREKLEEEMSKFHTESESAKSAFEKIKLEKSQIEEQLKNLEYENLKIHDELDLANMNAETLIKEKSNLVSEIESFKAEKEVRNSKLNIENNETSKLNEELELSKLSIENLSKEISELQNKISELTEELEFSNQSNEILSKEKSELQNQISDLSEKIESTNSSLEILSKEKSELQNKISELTQELESEKESVESLKKEKSDFENKIKIKNSELHENSTLNLEIQEKLKLKDSEIAKLNEDILNIQNELNKLRNMQESSNHNKEELTTKLEEEISHVNEGNKKLETELNSLKVQFEFLTAENEKLESELTSLKEQFDHLSTEKTDLLSQIEILNTENEEKIKLEFKIKKCEDSIENLKKEKHSLLAQIKKLAESNEKTSTHLEKKNEEFSKLENDYSQLTNKHEEIQKNLSEAHMKISNIEDSIKDQSVIEAKAEDFAKLKATNSENEATILKLTKEKNDLENLLFKSKQSGEIFTNEIESRANEINSLLRQKDIEIEKFKADIITLKEKVNTGEENTIRKEKLFIESIKSLNLEAEEKEVIITDLQKLSTSQKESINELKEKIFQLEEEERVSKSVRNVLKLEIENISKEKTDLIKDYEDKLENLKQTLTEEKNRKEEKEIKYFTDQIDSLQKEVEDYKNLNNRLIFQVEELKRSNLTSQSSQIVTESNYEGIKTIKEIDDEEDSDSLKLQIDHLKELVKNKEDLIAKITAENDNYKAEIEKILKMSEDPGDARSRMSIVSSVGNGEEIDFKKTNDKLDKYRKTIEHLKQDNELLSQQLSLLKGEIKNFKAKLEEIKTFDGKFTDYEEIKLSMLKVLENYKPKKKEFEEIAKKLKDHLNNVEVPIQQSESNKTSQGNDTKNSESSNKEKKKGFFGKMFTKKEK